MATLFDDPRDRARMGHLMSTLTNDAIIAEAGAYADFLLARPEATGALRQLYRAQLSGPGQADR